MREKLKSDILKKIALVSVNYQLIVNVTLILLTVITSNFVAEPLMSGIERHSLTAILWTITIPPIIEELFYRNFLYIKISKKLGKRRSMIISSLLFAVLHLNPLVALFAYGIGIISCKILEETRDIRYSIIFHSICNLFSSLFHNIVMFNTQGIDINSLIVQVVIISILLISIGIYIKYTSKIFKKIKD